MVGVNLSYPVILRPSDVKFTCKSIPTKFDNGNKLEDVLEEMTKGRILPKEIPAIEVVWYCDKWEWYTLNNRRLWLFQELEKKEEIKYASMNRIEVMNSKFIHPSKLYAEVILYDPPWDLRTTCVIPNTTNCLSTHSLDSGECTPSVSGDEDDVITLLSFKSPSKSSTRRKRTESSGTTVNEDVVMEIDEDILADMDVDIKYNTDNSRLTRKVISPTRRSRSPTRRSRSPTQKKKKRKRSDKKLARSRSFGREKRSKSVSTPTKKDDSKSISTPTKKDDSKSINKNSVSTDNALRSRSRSAGRNLRSKSVCTPTRSEKKCIARYNSFSTDMPFRDRSRSKSVGRYTRAQSVMSTPSKKFSTLYSDNTRFRDRTRSKSVMSMKSVESNTSLNNWSLVERKRSPSVCSHLSRRSESDAWSFDSRRRRSSSVCSHRSIKSTASAMDYQLDKFAPEKAARYQRPRRNKFIENDCTDDYNSRAMVKLERDGDSRHGSGTLIVKQGIQLSELYSLWLTRRTQFLEARQSGRLHLMYGPEEGYLCGLCFRKFKKVVDLQQHSEEKLHYACITCGRFFNTYTALGQHCNALNHTKD